MNDYDDSYSYERLEIAERSAVERAVAEYEASLGSPSQAVPSGSQEVPGHAR